MLSQSECSVFKHWLDVQESRDDIATSSEDVNVRCEIPMNLSEVSI